MNTRTLEELAAAQAALTEISAQHPGAVLMTILDRLVESVSGVNPALKDYMRLRFYRDVLASLAERGIR